MCAGFARSASVIVCAALAEKYVIEDGVPGIVDADEEQQQGRGADAE
jgi:uncharacterized protein YbaR (Trm112 family)